MVNDIHAQQMDPVEEMSREDLIKWAAHEIRQLDELCRSMIPGYQTLSSPEMARLKALENMEFVDKEAIIEEHFSETQ